MKMRGFNKNVKLVAGLKRVHVTDCCHSMTILGVGGEGLGVGVGIGAEGYYS